MADTRTLQPREKEELQDEGTRPGPVFRPDVDILERQNEFLVYADLPGADESSVDVRIDKGKLTLDARLGTEPDPKWNEVHSEYRWGSYHREFRVSDDIDAAGVSAKMKDGVLELHLPKTAATQPRTIPITSA